MSTPKKTRPEKPPITEFAAALGRSLRMAREAVYPPLTQRDVAKLVDRSPGAVCLWEKGENEPAATTLPLLAKLYGVTCDWLIGLDEGKMAKVTQSNQPPPLHTVPLIAEQDTVKWKIGSPVGMIATERQYTPGTTVAIQVTGNSMPKICPEGAYAVVSQAKTAKVGELILAVIGDDKAPVLRSIVQDGSTLYLVAEDARYPTHVFNDSVRVVGRVNEVIEMRRLLA